MGHGALFKRRALESLLYRSRRLAYEAKRRREARTGCTMPLPFVARIVVSLSVNERA